MSLISLTMLHHITYVVANVGIPNRTVTQKVSRVAFCIGRDLKISLELILMVFEAIVASKQPHRLIWSRN